jgi:hypothetical protein
MKRFRIAEAVKNRNELMAFLIERQLVLIGHLTINELIKFSEKKLKFKYTSSQATKLNGIYLVRNIIAHNTDLVRPSHRSKLPETIRLVKNELRVTDAYLRSAANTIESCVLRIEKHVMRKFLDLSA